MIISTREAAQKSLNERRGDTSIEFVEDYKGDKKRHMFRCQKCKHDWTSTPNTLKRSGSTGCPNCQKIVNQKKSKAYKQAIDLNKAIDKIRADSKSLSTSNLNRSQEFKTAKAKARLALEQEYIKAKNGLIVVKQNKPHFLSRLFTSSGREYREKIEEFETKLRSLPKKSKGSSYSACSIARVEKDIISRINTEKLFGRLNIKYGGKTSLYYLRLKSGYTYYYKIGITKNDIETRFGHFGVISRVDKIFFNPLDSKYSYHLSDIHPLIDKVFFDQRMKNAKEIERLILKAFREDLAGDRDLLGGNGHTEVFARDVLRFD